MEYVINIVGFRDYSHINWETKVGKNSWIFFFFFLRFLLLLLPCTKDRHVVKPQTVGADVNQKLFKGYATTVAVREGHVEILTILLKAGASQPACEEALLEASCHGQATLTELLMGSDMIRPHVAVHALVTACCQGFADVVDTLLKVNHHICH